MEKQNNDDFKNSTADFQLDEILKELGGFKKYQLTYCLLVSLPIVLMACHITTFVFTVSVPGYRCAIPECETGEFHPVWLNFTTPQIDGEFDKCKRYAAINYNDSLRIHNSADILNQEECNPNHFDKDIQINCKKWIYSDMNSIVSEFDLGCEQWKQTFVGTMNSIGSLLGTFLTGVLCDIYGRKTILIGGMFLSGISGLARIFSPGYWMYVILELLSGFFVAGVFNVSVIMCVEIVETKYRVLASMFSCYTYALGEIILGAVAWAFPYWKYILAILYFPSLFFIVYIWYIPESVKWLLGEHRLDEITKIINKAAEVNKIKLSQEGLLNFCNTVERNKSMTNLQQTQENNNSFIQLLKSKVLVFRLFICSMWFLLTSFIYFGLSFNPAMLSENIHLNFILVSLAEIPGYTVYYFAVERYGRKMPMMISFILTGLMCISFVLVPEGMLWLNITLFLCGKFFITISFTVVYIYSAELFPTFIRGTVLGICSVLGGIGVILAPQIPLLSSYMKSLPFLLFGGSGIVCGLGALMVPETSNVKLPDTLEEAANIGKSNQSLEGSGR